MMTLSTNCELGTVIPDAFSSVSRQSRGSAVVSRHSATPMRPSAVSSAAVGDPWFAGWAEADGAPYRLFGIGIRRAARSALTLIASASAPASRLVMRYQLRSGPSSCAAGGPMPRALNAAAEAASSGRRSTTRRINVSRPGHDTSDGSVGLIVSMVMRPRPTRASTASRWGLPAPSGTVEAPGWGRRPVTKMGRPLGGWMGTHRL